MPSLALATGLMFTPDTLTLFGNSLGAVGWFLGLMIPVAAIIHLVTIRNLKTLSAGTGNHLVGFQDYLGRRRAAVILLCGKLPFAVCASAALAVTSGFIFNEVFVYWFPNFAFAFILLGATGALNLISKSAARAMQVIAVSVVCIGLIILCGAGLSHMPGEWRTYDFNFDFSYKYLAAVFVVLIGYDLGLYANENDSSDLRRSGAMIAAVIGGALILAFWGLSVMAVVPPERLESSTVPYMTAARKSLGQPGRYMMGTVAITAVFSALNAMMHSVSLMAGQLANLYKNSGGINQPTIFRPATVLLMTGASGVLMAMGFAGEPHLETWIRAGIALWMIYYIVVNVTAVNTSRQKHVTSPRDQKSTMLPFNLFSIGALALAVTGIIRIDPDPVQFLTFSIIVIAMLVVVVYLFDKIINHSR